MLSMFTDTTFRDGHQSLIATRMKTSEILGIIEEVDSIGFQAFEVWGGATFDVCVRFLNEDPWERIREIRKRLKNGKAQMLLRGQNLVGYRHYADDVVELFVKKAIENGVQVIRIFDALNDIRNLEKSIEVALKCGAHVQGAISYTTSPVHTVEYYLDYAQQLVDRGVNSLCIKDMAGLLTPKMAGELVSQLKKKFDLPVEVHTHATAGLGELAYLSAFLAGADIVDTAISPFGMTTSQPAFEAIYYSFSEYKKLPEIDWKKIDKIVKYLWDVRKKHENYDVKMYSIDHRIITSQVPGGMYSNLVKQLSEQKLLHKLDAVLEEIPKVRADLGYPPLVTPTSQIVGVQAVLNVMTGERYAKVTREVKDYVKGLYGKPPAPINEELIQKILGDERPIEGRPADYIEPELEKRRKEIGVLAETDEELLIYAILGEIGKQYLKKKYDEKIQVDWTLVENFEGGYPV
ncbi:Conserved carboxylase region [Fervidobacterium nodosum Rt17-B1]|uniref:Conserved carboxylase region n=2 Tax=Fervidobacterium nodosum TaxID=2424 RepID=A7HNV5_FERNB|nr:Conserved carboxylase region [Fervidobacterium nodosum Rt17-B1]